MRDNAHIVRDGIEPHPCTAEHFGVDDCQTCRNALAALDALVAERDEAQDKVLAATDYIARAEAAESNAQVFHDEWDKALAERDEARLSLKLSESAQVVFRDRALAAEAEVVRLREAMVPWRLSLAAQAPNWAWIVSEIDAALGEEA